MVLRILEEQINNARLNIYQPDGQILRLGHSGPLIDWHIHGNNTLSDIVKRPGLKLGNSYVKNEWDVNGAQLPDLIEAVVPHKVSSGLLGNRPCLRRLRARLPHLRQAASQPHWSDNNLWLARICLGNELMPHCAFYTEPGVSTEQAQRTARHRLINRLRLNSQHHLLDLNAGWGTLAMQLAEQTGARVTALVTTREQLQFAHNEVRRRGLDGQVHVRLGSFHQCRGRFDRILAGGFLENFAEPTYPVIFEHLEDLLQDNGLAWVEVTGRSLPAGLSHQWHQQQLPARYSLPLMSDLVDGLEATGLRTLTMEDHSSHQVRDLCTQARRFESHRSTISQRFGENQTRHWEFLLASQITAFRRGQLRQYEFLLGNAHAQLPAEGFETHDTQPCLPTDVAKKIPGLARDI